MTIHWNISKTTFESDKLNKDLSVSPWSGHRLFAYDLIRFLQPKLIVELGTHFGCSFFAFCQAIKDHALDTKIVGVDTWSGDPHAGYYDESVFEIVNKTISTYFENVSLELKRMLFAEAVRDFENDSIELLHIDGLHTYEAVKEDFETWIPKLKPDGIVLFHDIADYTGYGSHQYWEELKQKYPYYFEFHHSWGLGVLFPKGSKFYEKLMKENMQDKVLIYQYYADLLLYKVKVNDVEQMALERYSAMQNMDKMISERDEVISAQSKLLEERHNAMQNMDKMISERDEVISAQSKLLEERYNTMQNMDKMISERDEAVAAQTKLIEERYNTIQNMDKMIAVRDETIERQANFLEERDAIVEKYRQELEARNQENYNLKKRLEKITKYLFWLRKP